MRRQRQRNTQTRDYGGLLERLVFLPGAVIMIYGFWLLVAG